MTWFTVATAAVTAASAIAGGDAQRRAANTNADIAEQNRKLAAEQGFAREDAFRRQARMRLGSQAAAIAESGVDPGSGSALLVAAQSATNAELDALNIRYEGLTQATGYAREAVAERRRGLNATQGSYYSAAASILDAASRAGGVRPTTSPGGYGSIDPAGDTWGGPG